MNATRKEDSQRRSGSAPQRDGAAGSVRGESWSGTESAARCDRERADSWASFLSTASRTLASSLDYDETLYRVARLVTPQFADWCFIDILGEGGTIRRVAVTYADPAKREIAALMPRVFGPDEIDRRIVSLAADGCPGLIREIPDELLQQIAKDEDHLRALRGAEACCGLCVPLVARGTTLGTMTLLNGAGRPAFTEGDLQRMLDLANTAALAVDNARLYSEAEAANRAKSDFLAVMSHELRTPLSAIMGYVNLVTDGVLGPVDEVQRNHLERALVNSRHLLHMIDEILAFSRSEMGREQVRRERFDARAVVRAASTEIEPGLRAKGLEIWVSLPDRPIIMKSDPDKVRQILTNLLSNAVKFTAKGEVTVSVREEEDQVVFSVHDTGPGIAPEHLETIFEPFRQIEPSITRTTGGAGLGLTVARRYAQLLGGDVGVVSTPGEGSLFRVTLPRKNAVEPSGHLATP
jgi:signal transduction histidine kinase